MATTTINPDVIAVVITILFLTLVCSAAFITLRFAYKCVVWCFAWASERRAAKFLSRFGNHGEDLVDSLLGVGGVDNSGKATQRANGVRGWTRVRRGAITQIAMSLADEAYLQFGRRDRSRANDLVTRKFMRDRLSEFDSLRAKDKSSVIEIAMALSYVPPNEYSWVSELENTAAYAAVVQKAKAEYR